MEAGSEATLEKVRVAVRVRKWEEDAQAASQSGGAVSSKSQAVTTTDKKVSIRSRSGKASLEFEFDVVFGEAASQQEVFRYVQPLVRGTTDGINTTIFACNVFPPSVPLPLEPSQANHFHSAPQTDRRAQAKRTPCWVEV